ncbi:hypothetical protein SD70_20000 [Gordoniibacillus kamchatkensis]|uniref:Nudix hydrolase domain-containing protein n=1 Tax=Gordoniibacillus kamchatkensis TaxID=1590651 RepID=A0ABR5AER9_9BACL|nr:NUDIX hydrolase [Paenibacillus sp. VKM B-2647]KIL39455.1 hypothetical protein SD70_20000 [Paenibacillus sp. VKM B-2647]
MQENVAWHRQLGVYGICVKDSKLLVIHKNGGPYNSRYDLPGGSIEPNEPLPAALHREILEETGVSVRIIGHIGTRDFVVPWTRERYSHTHSHHIAIFYEVEYISGDVRFSPNVDDSSGAEWLDADRFAWDNSSPLVMQAVEWLAQRTIPVDTRYFTAWETKL